MIISRSRKNITYVYLCLRNIEFSDDHENLNDVILIWFDASSSTACVPYDLFSMIALRTQIFDFLRGNWYYKTTVLKWNRMSEHFESMFSFTVISIMYEQHYIFDNG